MATPYDRELESVLEALQRPRTFSQLSRALPELHPLFLATSLSHLRSEGQVTSDTSRHVERFRRVREAA